MSPMIPAFYFPLRVSGFVMQQKGFKKKKNSLAKRGYFPKGNKWQLTPQSAIRELKNVICHLGNSEISVPCYFRFW